MKSVFAICAFLPFVLSLGQNATITLTKEAKLLQLAGSDINGQILLSSNDWWGVIRAAEDLAGDFGKVTGKNLTLGNSKNGRTETITYEYREPTSNTNVINPIPT